MGGLVQAKVHYIDIFIVHATARALCVCLSLYVCLSVSVCVSVCLCMCVCLSVCVSVCLSVSMSLCLSVHLSVCPSVCLSVCLSVYLSVYLSVCVSVSPPVEGLQPLLPRVVIQHNHPLQEVLFLSRIALPRTKCYPQSKQQRVTVGC